MKAASCGADGKISDSFSFFLGPATIGITPCSAIRERSWKRQKVIVTHVETGRSSVNDLPRRAVK